MKCKLLYKNLIGYAEHTLPEDLKKELDNHIHECEACKKLYDQVLDTYRSMDNLIVPEMNPYFYTRVAAKLKAGTEAKPVFVSQVMKRVKPVAVTMLIAASIGMGIFIGKNLTTADLSRKPNRSEILEAYATDYYLTGTVEENADEYTNNE